MFAADRPPPLGPTWVWGLALAAIVLATGIPGVLYAVLEGRTRTTALVSWIGLELLAVVCIGLYLRLRSH